ncbi:MULTISPECIES: hypothetical protein [Deferrisoma]
MRLRRAFLFAVAVLPLCGPAARAEWPYLTEEASTLGERGWSASLGVSRTWQHSEFLRGGKGVLWTFPEVEATLGVGPHAEVSAQYELLWFDPADDREGSYESGDVRLWTKLSLFPETLRGFSFRFGVKLPNASDRRGLGTDETDVFLTGLWDVEAGPVLVSLNAGLGILGDPTKNGSQDDVFTWAGAARLPLAGGRFRVGVDAAGYSGPFGVHRKRDFATYGVVLDWVLGRWRLSLGGRRGTQDALGWGWVAGVTYGR